MDEVLEIEHTEPREEIARLEARIEELADKIENCGKFILASRVAIALGSFLVLAGLIGAIRLDPMVMAIAVVAVVGGIVLFGSNHGTAKEASAQLEAAEARRAALISQLELRVVIDRDGAGLRS
jgi:hypothetical protein